MTAFASSKKMDLSNSRGLGVEGSDFSSDLNFLLLLCVVVFVSMILSGFGLLLSICSSDIFLR